ncbi:MAG: hypothetical protein KAS95_07425, partial [Candidatus Heimdallarchaeota archaeon]|nr:hypothetical protein [Candidatus Heimdallarchaeota archaeon]
KDLLDRRLHKAVWEKIIDESTAKSLGITIDELCKLTAQESFVKNVIKYGKDNNLNLKHEMKIDSTYKLSTINELEFQTSNIYIYDPYNRISSGTKSFTLSKALNTTKYISTFSGSSAYRALFTLVRVYAHPEDVKTVNQIWDDIRPQEDESSNVSLTSY